MLRVIVAYLRDVAERRGVLVAYEQWHGKVVEKKTMAAKAVKVVYRWVHRCVRQAMDAWHGSTVKEARKRSFFIRIVQRMQNAALYKADGGVVCFNEGHGTWQCLKRVQG